MMRLVDLNFEVHEKTNSLRGHEGIPARSFCSFEQFQILRERTRCLCTTQEHKKDLYIYSQYKQKSLSCILMHLFLPQLGFILAFLSAILRNNLEFMYVNNCTWRTIFLTKNVLQIRDIIVKLPPMCSNLYPQKKSRFNETNKSVIRFFVYALHSNVEHAFVTPYNKNQRNQYFSGAQFRLVFSAPLVRRRLQLTVIEYLHCIMKHYPGKTWHLLRMPNQPLSFATNRTSWCPLPILS